MAMSNAYKLQKMALLLLVLMLLSVLEVSAFQVIPVVVRRTTTKPATTVSRTTLVLWNKATNGEKAEECMMTDLQRARDCASNIGECSVEELEELSNGMYALFLSSSHNLIGFCSHRLLSNNQNDFLTHSLTHSLTLSLSLAHRLAHSPSRPIYLRHT